MKEKLEQIKLDFSGQMEHANTKDALEQIRVGFLGKKGILTEVLKGMKDLSIEEKKEIGAITNQMKDQFEDAVKARAQQLEEKEINKKLESEWIDISWPIEENRGTIHPLIQVRNRLIDIFVSMGFEILDGPEMEDEENNFNKLNIPADHPARDGQDTFWLDNGKLMRTQTSTIQIHGMEGKKPPFKFIAPGRVFRNESVDATHGHTFHQVECMVVDRGISVSHLIYTLEQILSGIFEKPVEVRLRPSFFPFVEPGFEVDFKCLMCGGKGCSACKNAGWIEYLGCGMVHPNVLRNGGIDPDEFSGFAFGLGLERLSMQRFGINDIRHFFGNDLRFLKQF